MFDFFNLLLLCTFIFTLIGCFFGDGAGSGVGVWFGVGVGFYSLDGFPPIIKKILIKGEIDG